MKKHPPLLRHAIGLILLGVFLALAAGSRGAKPGISAISPDKKWEYTCEEYGKDQCSPEIVNIATQDIVLDLSDLPTGNWADRARVVWAPDSQRFGFNHSAPHASQTNYETIVIYQLRDNKWVPLDLPFDKAPGRSQLAQLTRKYAPKSQDRLASSPASDILRVRKWSDASTAVLFARADEAAALFTVKFDPKGKSKIVEMRRLSKAEIEKRTSLSNALSRSGMVETTPVGEN